MQVKKALQGHPESPRLWATLIDGIIKKLGFRACQHEPFLYAHDNYKGNKVFFHSVWVLKHPEYKNNILYAEMEPDQLKPAKPVKVKVEATVCKGFNKKGKPCQNKVKCGEFCHLHKA